MPRTRTRALQLVALAAAAALTAGTAAPGVAAKPPTSPYAYTVADFPSPTQREFELAIDPEYDTLYAYETDGNEVHLVDSVTGTVRATVDGVSGGSITVDTASHVAYVRDFDAGTLIAIDRSGSTRSVDGMGATVSGIAADPRTHEIYGADVENGTVNVVAAAGGRVATIPVGRQPYIIAIDDPGRRAYVTNLDDKSVSIIDLDTHAVVATVGVDATPYDIAVDVVTHRAYVGLEYDHDVAVIDGGTNRVVDTITTPFNTVADIEIDSVTHTAYARGDSASVAAIDLTTDTVTMVPTVEAPSFPGPLAVDPVRHVAFANGDGNIRKITQHVVQKAVVTGLSATSGSTAGGEQITITGDHFAGATKVFFGNTAATTFTVESDEQIVVTVPAHKAGKVPVRVKTVGRSALGKNSRYTYVAPAG